MSKKTKILEMNDALFVQRRRVINMLYDARKVIGKELPRIKVRIAEYEKRKGEKVLGRCFIDKDYITISGECSDWSDDYLRQVVWHELGHAYWNAKHDEKCPLMHPYQNETVPRSVLVKALKKIAGTKTEDALCS